jgi:hypothetical protein
MTAADILFLVFATVIFIGFLFAYPYSTGFIEVINLYKRWRHK